MHLDLAVATMCLALMMDTPALLRSRMPDIADLTGPGDPRITRDKVVQGFLHTFTACLNLWERRDFGASLMGMLKIK